METTQTRSAVRHAGYPAPPMTPEAPPPAPARARAYAPGEKRARHKRWTRIATIVTVVGMVAFAAFLGVLALTRSNEDDRGTGIFLERIAKEVRVFQSDNGRLPERLEDLSGPLGRRPFDAEIWDAWHKPFEYRVVDARTGEFRLRSLGPDKTPDTADDVVWPAGASWR